MRTETGKIIDEILKGLAAEWQVSVSRLKGELKMTNQAWVPEVGSSVKTRDKINPREHVVIAIDGDMAWIKLAYQKQRGQLYPLEQLTPWLTDEDKAVEEMLKDAGIPDAVVNTPVMRALYNAGWRKQPQCRCHHYPDKDLTTPDVD